MDDPVPDDVLAVLVSGLRDADSTPGREILLRLLEELTCRRAAEVQAVSEALERMATGIGPTNG